MSKSDRIREINDGMMQLMEEARLIARTSLSRFDYEHYKAYVFNIIEAHLEKANPYDRDMNDLANAVEATEEPEEDEEEDE